MPTPKKGPRLGGSPQHQRHILRNLATQLIEHGSLRTTETKAKTLQPMFEKLVTKAKRGDLHARRTVAKTITSKDAVYNLFDVIVPSMDPERNGGYTRVTRIGNRRGDNSPMALIEIVTEPVFKKAVVKEATQATKKAAKKIEEPAVESSSDVAEAVAVEISEDK